MATNTVPPICAICVIKHQAQCDHLHTITTGGYHFSVGDVWDDIREFCLDCGADLSDIPVSSEKQNSSLETVPF